jgi:hypothetical protein
MESEWFSEQKVGVALRSDRRRRMSARICRRSFGDEVKLMSSRPVPGRSRRRLALSLTLIYALTLNMFLAVLADLGPASGGELQAVASSLLCLDAGAPADPADRSGQPAKQRPCAGCNAVCAAGCCASSAAVDAATAAAPRLEASQIRARSFDDQVLPPAKRRFDALAQVPLFARDRSALEMSGSRA